MLFSSLRKLKITNMIIDGNGTPEPVAEATFGFSDISEVMSNGSVVSSVGLTQGLLNLGISKTTSTGVQTYAFISTDKSVRFPPFFSRFYPCSYFASCCRSCCSLFCWPMQRHFKQARILTQYLPMLSNSLCRWMVCCKTTCRHLLPLKFLS